jgi:hypothetical protein
VKVVVLKAVGTSSPRESGEVVLEANESVRVHRPEKAETQLLVVRKGDVTSTDYARRLPKRVPIRLFNTGVGLKAGDSDPHWQLIAVSDRPKFQPHPAVVAFVPGWLRNEPDQSQWIAPEKDPGKEPDGATYVYRTTFDLAGMDSKTAFLRGQFSVDDQVTAIRVNGQEVSILGQDREGTYSRMYQFAVRQGFVDGLNTLDFEVKNLGNKSLVSPTGLLVEIRGSAVEAVSQVPAGK